MTANISPTITNISAEIIFVGRNVMVRLTAPNKSPQVVASEKWVLDLFNLNKEFNEANDWINRFSVSNKDWIPMSTRMLEKKLTSALIAEHEDKPSVKKFKNK